MSVIIRLQNLPWSANATDIRQFFKGLGIPDGGVHIVGGETGDAFIAFSTDDDARKAMRLDGGKLKEIQVRLFLSSRAEMQEVIETARQTTLSLMQLQRQQQVPAAAAAVTVAASAIAPQMVQSIQATIQPQMPMMLSSAVPLLAAQQQLYSATQFVPEKAESSSSNSKRRSRSSRSRSRSRDRYRRRSRSPRSRRRSDSRERDRRRGRTSRFDKDSSSSNKSSIDKRFHDQSSGAGSIAPTNAINPQLYQQNATFTTNGNIQPFLMPNQIDQNLQNMSQPQNHLGAFSTNDVRKMNMNIAMQTNPLAFSQMYAQQQQQQNVAASAFSTFSSNMPMQNQMAVGALNPMALNASASMANTNGDENAIHCVRIRGLNNFTNYSKIRKFFSGLPIPNDGIKIIHDNDGNRTGQAYVRFVRPNNVPQAIARSNQKVGGNVIQIQELVDKEFYDAIDAYRPQRRNNYRSDPRSRDRDHDSRRTGRRRGDYSDSNDEYDDEDRNSSKANSENERDNDVMCISDSNDSKEKESAPFTTVLIEDLPPFTKEQDIMKMFSSYPLVHIVMAKRPKMFSSYVRFHNAEDARAAVKNTSCHKISFKTVYVSACCEQEYETARREFSGDADFDEFSSSQTHDAPNYSEYQKAGAESNEIKSPDPSSENQNDTDSSANQNDDEQPKIRLDGIPGVNLADPRINSMKFQTNATAGDSDNLPRERIDPRTRAAVQTIDTNTFGNSMVENNPFAAGNNSGSNGGSNELPVCCILIENMEYRTTEQEIAEWLMQNVNLAPIRIQLLVNNRNQTNGEAFVQFADNEQATRAMSLHQTRFKSRSVRVSLATWQQVQETLHKVHEMLLEHGFGGINATNNNYNRDHNRGGSNTRFNNRDNHNNSNNSSHRMNNNNSSRNNHGNLDRCVVALSNVPYKANIDDILDFFDEYDITPENVIRRYNDEGKPTGDARICFKSPMEARRAVEQKDKCRIMNRPVFLNIL